MLLLLSQTEIGIYAAPISMLVAFAIPCTYMFLRSQLGAEPIEFPYLAMLQATLVAVGAGGRLPLRPPRQRVGHSSP